MSNGKTVDVDAHREIITKIDHEKLEAIIERAPKRENSTLEKLCRYLKEKSINLCPEEKAWLVFRWMGQNIEYDVEGLRSGAKVDTTPEGAFKSGKTICAGYSGMFKEISDVLEIEVARIDGYSKGAGYDPEVPVPKPDHDWNAVRIEGKWYLIDATWGGGSEINGKYVKKYSPFYFGADPKRFVRCHWPSDPQWQLLDNPISKEEFERLLGYDGNFYNYGLLSSDPDVAIISRNEMATFTIKYNPRIDMCVSATVEYFQDKEFKEIENSWFVKKLDEHFLCQVILNKKGKYKATFFASYPHEEKSRSIFTHIINCNKDAKTYREFPLFYTKYATSKSVLHEPMMGPLKFGSKVKFKIQIPGAEEAMVNTKSQVRLTKDGDMFTGEVEINADSIGIYFMYPGDTSYSGLVKYNVAK